MPTKLLRYCEMPLYTERASRRWTNCKSNTGEQRIRKRLVIFVKRNQLPSRSNLRQFRHFKQMFGFIKTTNYRILTDINYFVTVFSLNLRVTTIQVNTWPLCCEDRQSARQALVYEQKSCLVLGREGGRRWQKYFICSLASSRTAPSVFYCCAASTLYAMTKS